MRYSILPWPKGCSVSGFCPAHFKADQCEQGGTGIGKVVEGIRGNGYGPADGPGKKFPRDNKILGNSDPAAQDPVGLSDSRLLCLIIILY